MHVDREERRCSDLVEREAKRIDQEAFLFDCFIPDLADVFVRETDGQVVVDEISPPVNAKETICCSELRSDLPFLLCPLWEESLSLSDRFCDRINAQSRQFQGRDESLFSRFPDLRWSRIVLVADVHGGRVPRTNDVSRRDREVRNLKAFVQNDDCRGP